MDANTRGYKPYHHNRYTPSKWEGVITQGFLIARFGKLDLTITPTHIYAATGLGRGKCQEVHLTNLQFLHLGCSEKFTSIPGPADDKKSGYEQLILIDHQEKLFLGIKLSPARRKYVFLTLRQILIDKGIDFLEEPPINLQEHLLN